MNKIFLDGGDLLVVQGVLDQFVGLPLTDVWGRWDEMRFEFGEQKHFIDRGGEDLLRAAAYVEAKRRFRIDGLGSGVIDETRFYDEDDNLIALSQQFVQGAEAGEWKLESYEVFADGRLCLQLSDGISIDISSFIESDLVRAENEVVDCWSISWQGDIWTLYTDELDYSPSTKGTTDLPEETVQRIRDALESLRGQRLTKIAVVGDETEFSFGDESFFRSSIPIHLAWGNCRQPLRWYPKSDEVQALADAMIIDSLERAGKYRKSENVLGVFDLWVSQGKHEVAEIRIDSRGCFAIDLRNPEKNMGDYFLVLSHGYFLTSWGWEIRSGNRIWQFDGKRIFSNP